MLHGTAECELAAVERDGRLHVRSDQLANAVGWRLAADHACAGVRRCRISPLLDDDGLVDPLAVAHGLGIGTAVHRVDGRTVLALGPRYDVPPLLGVGELAPVVELVDRSGRIVDGEELSGRRRVLIAVASWCGCREDPPQWQRLADSLPVDGPELILVAIDDEPARMDPWLEGVELRVLFDPHREFCAAYGVLNVPTVIWVDADDRVVRPARQVFADNRLVEHHGIDCSDHHDALRRWSSTGTPPPEKRVALDRLPAERRSTARAEFRLATWLIDHRRPEDGATHLDQAGEQAPDDLTIRRAAIQLRGGDPFGEEFRELARDWAVHTGGISYLPDRRSAAVDHAAFERNGFDVVSFLGTDEVSELRRRFDALDLTEDHPFFTSCNDLPRSLATALDADLRALLANRVRQLLPGYRIFLASFISKGAGAGALEYHQDLTYTDERTSRAVLIWAPLEDTHGGAGALSAIPGSHRWTTGIRPGRIGPPPTAGLQGPLGALATVLDVRAGEAVIYDPALVHGSEHNSVARQRPVLGLATAPTSAALVHFFEDRDGDVAGAYVDEGFASEHSLFGPPEGFPPVPAWAPVVSAADLELAVEALDEHRDGPV